MYVGGTRENEKKADILSAKSGRDNDQPFLFLQNSRMMQHITYGKNLRRGGVGFKSSDPYDNTTPAGEGSVTFRLIFFF